ncbi:MAG: hypothetical protein ACFCBV_03210 [Phycisphaerales bacterium]
MHNKWASWKSATSHRDPVAAVPRVHGNFTIKDLSGGIQGAAKLDQRDDPFFVKAWAADINAVAHWVPLVTIPSGNVRGQVVSRGNETTADDQLLAEWPWTVRIPIR